MADKSASRSKNSSKQKQAAAVATTLAKVRLAKHKDPKGYASRRKRAELSDDEPIENATDEENMTPSASEDDLSDEEGAGSDDGRTPSDDNNGGGEDQGLDSDDSDDGVITKEQFAKMKNFNRSLMKKLDGLQALFEQNGVANMSSGPKSTGKSGKKKLHAIPANRSALTVDEFQAYLGIEGNHDRWLAIRNHARGIVGKANFDWSLPWASQDLTVRNQAGIALRQLVSEFEPFVSNWGANHMVQDTFNHRRNRPGPAKAKATSPAVRVDKRKRAYKETLKQEALATSGGVPVGVPTGPGVGASVANTLSGPATDVTAPARTTDNVGGQAADVSNGNNPGTGSGAAPVRSHPSIDSTLKESSQEVHPTSSRPVSKSPAKDHAAPRPRPVTRSSGSILDENPADRTRTRSKKATVEAKARAGGSKGSSRKGKEAVQPAEVEGREAKRRRITR